MIKHEIANYRFELSSPVFNPWWQYQRSVQGLREPQHTQKVISLVPEPTCKTNNSSSTNSQHTSNHFSKQQQMIITLTHARAVHNIPIDVEIIRVAQHFIHVNDSKTKD